MTAWIAYCAPQCQLRSEVIGEEASDAIAAAYEGPGGNLRIYNEKINAILGRDVDYFAARRHAQNHMRELEPENGPGSVSAGPQVAMSDKAMLDMIIVAAQQNSRRWRPTIRDALDALKLKQSMGGDDSQYDPMLDAIELAIQSNEEEAKAERGEPNELASVEARHLAVMGRLYENRDARYSAAERGIPIGQDDEEDEEEA